MGHSFEASGGHRTYETLNGMRGLAAVAVVFVHESGLMLPLAAPNGGLAVDFFFLLSGFVLTAAYAGRLDQGMPARSFLIARYVRFYPLAILGILLGALSTAALMFTGKSALGLSDYLVALLAGLVLLPSPAGLYILDGPLWSLLLEFIANSAFAGAWRWINRRVLYVVVLVALFAVVGWTTTHGTIEAGYEWSSFAGGLTRVAFSFFAGVLIFKAKGPDVSLPAWLGPILFAALAVTLFGQIGPRWLHELISIAVIFPALVWLGSNVEWNPGQISTLLGRISFPLYVIHVPLFSLLAGVLAVLIGHSIALSGAPWSGVSLLAVCILAAYALDRWYDGRARRLLLQLIERRDTPNVSASVHAEDSHA